MMTHRKQCLSKGTSATQGKTTSISAKRSSSTHSFLSRVPANKGPVQAPLLADRTHPVELERQPITGNSTTAEGTQELTTSLIPLPVSIPDLTSPDLAVSAAVIKGLSEVGIILSANTVPTT